MKATYIYHLQLKETSENFYFGSRAAIFEVFTTHQLGIAYNTLKKKKLPTEKEPYENDICIIKLGKLIRKEKKVVKQKI